MKQFFLLFVIFSGSVFFTPILQAQEGPLPKLFLLPTQSVKDSMSSIVPEKIGELLRQRILQDGRVELMPDFSTVKKDLGGGSAVMVEAEKLYTSGIGQLTAGNDKKAVEAFTRSIEIMESNLAELENFNILADAIANLALANFNAGFNLDARKGIKLYAQIRPDVVLDKEKFSKELIKIHEAEAKKIKKAGPGKLTIKSEGEALIYIDGVEKGKAPGVIDDIGFGHHYLIVRSSNGDAYSKKIKVRGKKKKQSFTATLQPSGASKGNTGSSVPEFYVDLLATLKSGKFDTTSKPYLSELANQTGADYIGFVLMIRQGNDYVAVPFVFRKSDERLIRSTDENFNIELSNLIVGVNTLSGNVIASLQAMPESAVVSEVSLGQVKKASVIVKKAPVKKGPVINDKTKVVGLPPTPKPSESSSSWTYVWVGVGLVAAAGAAYGIYYLMEDSGASTGPGFTAEVTW